MAAATAKKSIKLSAPVKLAIAYLALESSLLLAGMLASDRSYVVWAISGIGAGFMMIFGGFAGLFSFAIGIFEKNQNALISGALLLMGCAIPILLLLAGSFAFGF